jgi:hypothetical protein
MTNNLDPKTDPNEPTVYQIKLRGHVDPEWTDWLAGMTISLRDNGETVLTGPLMDQAALHGLLKKIRDLGVPLLSVMEIERDRADTTDGKQ